MEGTVINARVFSRKGVTKDERTRLIEEDETAKLGKDEEDEQRIIRELTLKKLKKLLVGKERRPTTDDSRRVILPKGKIIVPRGFRSGSAVPVGRDQDRGREG